MIADMVEGTPIWVWVLLVYLIVRGVKATKAGTTRFWRLLIIPLLFTTIGLYGLITTLKLRGQICHWLPLGDRPGQRRIDTIHSFLRGRFRHRCRPVYWTDLDLL